VRVAVAAGRAFTFGYAEHRELLEAAGAEVAEFDPMTAEHLPEGTDALVVGGGFPEVYVEDLAANVALRAEVRERVTGGMPVVAECAGLLWLGSSLDGREQCGVLPAQARMTGRLTLGYREAVALADSPLAAAGTVIRAHEFHRTVTEPAAGPSPAWQLTDGTLHGWATPRLLASYLHLHWAGLPDAAPRLVAAARTARHPLAKAARAKAPPAHAPPAHAPPGNISPGNISPGKAALPQATPAEAPPAEAPPAEGTPADATPAPPAPPGPRAPEAQEARP
jgi:cobyrinic acid a,c-diamide synthase